MLTPTAPPRWFPLVTRTVTTSIEPLMSHLIGIIDVPTPRVARGNHCFFLKFPVIFLGREFHHDRNHLIFVSISGYTDKKSSLELRIFPVFFRANS